MNKIRFIILPRNSLKGVIICVLGRPSNDPPCVCIALHSRPQPPRNTPDPGEKARRDYNPPDRQSIFNGPWLLLHVFFIIHSSRYAISSLFFLKLVKWVLRKFYKTRFYGIVKTRLPLNGRDGRIPTMMLYSPRCKLGLCAARLLFTSYILFCLCFGTMILIYRRHSGRRESSAQLRVLWVDDRWRQCASVTRASGRLRYKDPGGVAKWITVPTGVLMPRKSPAEELTSRHLRKVLEQYCVWG
jgi:hypothetical protein